MEQFVLRLVVINLCKDCMTEPQVTTRDGPHRHRMFLSREPVWLGFKHMITTTAEEKAAKQHSKNPLQIRVKLTELPTTVL